MKPVTQALMMLALLFLLLECSACEYGKTNPDPLRAARNEDTILKENSSSLPSQIVGNFMKWHRDMQDSLGELVLVNTDTTRPYSVNFAGTKKYLAFFARSGYVSDSYIAYWREYFKKCQQDFLKNPQYDDPPNGFDYDFVMGGHEYEDDLENLDKSTSLTGFDSENKAYVILLLASQSKLKFKLSKRNDKWLIDKIEHPN